MTRYLFVLFEFSKFLSAKLLFSFVKIVLTNFVLLISAHEYVVRNLVGNEKSSVFCEHLFFLL
jgi:hypothetical protein